MGGGSGEEFSVDRGGMPGAPWDMRDEHTPRATERPTKQAGRLRSWPRAAFFALGGRYTRSRSAEWIWRAKEKWTFTHGCEPEPWPASRDDLAQRPIA